jgi:hypothetical protein
MDMGFDGLGWVSDPETFVRVVVVLVLGGVALSIVGRLAGHLRLRSTASSEGWRWLGRSQDFGRVVASAFPDLARAAKRSARRSASRGGNGGSSNGSRGGNGLQRAAGLALDISGAGTRARVSSRGRQVAVASGVLGEVTVGEAVVSARSHRRRVGNRGGGGHGTSSVRATAAAARLGSSLPTIRLTPRTLLHRVTGDAASDGLPEELCKRFAIEELGAPAQVALIDSGAWRELLATDVKVQGLTVSGGHIVVMTRRRITPKRARALVRVVERLVAALPETAWSDGTRGRLSAAVGE